MDRIHIEGGRRLEGEVRVSGAKNAVLPLMASALLTDEEVLIRNVPSVRDVTTQARILRALGAEVDHDKEAHTLRIRVVDTDATTAPYELVSTMRASICVLGPLLARRGYARVSRPGGCVFGHRPIDLHLKGMESLGAVLEMKSGYIEAKGPLRGDELFLGGAFGSTVTGTANIVMAATLAEGTTVLENAALEPEIQELCQALLAMGADIEGVGTHRLVVRGVPKLRGGEIVVGADRIEAGTFLIGAVMSGGDVTVLGARADHLGAPLEVLRRAGASIQPVEGGLRATPNSRRLRGIDVTTFAYPGFPTDLQAQVMALSCLADGISVVTEKIYPDRFIHAAELNRMGAEIRKEGPQAIVSGVQELSGAPVMASDLRASAALVLAGLVATGETEIHRVYHIDRGYERIDEKLVGLGARIWRERD